MFKVIGFTIGKNMYEYDALFLCATFSLEILSENHNSLEWVPFVYNVYLHLVFFTGSLASLLNRRSCDLLH